MLAAACADVNKFACREAFKTFDADILLAQVAADESGVSLAYIDKRLACLMMRHASDIETLVLVATSKNGNVHHKVI